MKGFVLAGVLLAFAAAAAPKKPVKKAPPPPPPPALTAPSEKLGEAMGGKVAEQLTSAVKVEIARTSYVQGIRPNPKLAIGSDFQREGEWAEVDKDNLAKLRALLYAEKTFRLGADVSSCNFSPDVAY